MVKTKVPTDLATTNGNLQSGRVARKTGQVRQEILIQDHESGPIYKATVMVDYKINVSPDFECEDHPGIRRLLGMRRADVPIKIDRSPEELCTNIVDNIEARLEDHYDFNPLVGNGFSHESAQIFIPNRMRFDDPPHWEFRKYNNRKHPEWLRPGLALPEYNTFLIRWETGRHSPWGNAAIWPATNQSCMLFESLSAEYQEYENQKQRERYFRLNITMEKALTRLYLAQKSGKVDVPSRILAKYAQPFPPPKKPKKKTSRRQ